MPEPAIRLVATDLDGTLLHSDGTVTDRTRAALTAVEDLGVTVVFVTGRPIRWMDDLWEHVGGHGLAVCSNGGIVYDVTARAVRTARPIPVDVGLQVAGLLREARPRDDVRVRADHGLRQGAGVHAAVPRSPTTWRSGRWRRSSTRPP